MSYSYVMNRRVDKRRVEGKFERRSLHEDIATMLHHLDAYDVFLESIVVDQTTGEATITLSGRVPRDQMEHVGVVPESEVDASARVQ